MRHLRGSTLCGEGSWDSMIQVKGSAMNNYPQTPLSYSAPYIDSTIYSIIHVAGAIGIVLDNVAITDSMGMPMGLTIGNGGSAANPNTTIFDNLQNGITGTNSNLKINNCTFQNPSSAALTGISIGYDSTGMIDISTPAGSANNAFFNLPTAIEIGGGDSITIHDCDIRSKQDVTKMDEYLSNGNMGIYIGNNNFENIDIQNNKIYNTRNGINLLSAVDRRPVNSPPVNIGVINVNNNTIKHQLVGASDSTGNEYVENAINLTSQYVSGGDPLTCSSNTISGVFNGIKASNWFVRNTTIELNNIAMINNPSNVEQYGISVTGGIGNADTTAANPTGRMTNRVVNNTVKGDGGVNETAIYMESNSFMNVGCNTVLKVANGVEFAGGSNMSNNCADNTFDADSTTNMNGLTMYVADGSTISMGDSSTQCTADNMWTGSNWLAGSGNYKTNCSYTDATSLPMWVQYGSIYNPSGSYNPTGFQIKPYDTSVAGTIDVITPNTGGICPHCVYGISGQRMIQTVHKSFHMKGNNNNYINAVNFGENNSFSIPEKIALGQLLINSPDSAKRLYVMQQQLFSSLLANQTILNNSNILQNFVQSNSQSSLGIIHSLDSLFAIGDYTTASSLLSGWQPQNNVDFNYYKYYQWLIKIANLGLSSQDTTDIYALALGCPQTDGKIIFAARNLYSNITHRFINYPNTCSMNNISQSKQLKNIVKTTNNNNSGEIKVYPNPTKGEVNIQ